MCPDTNRGANRERKTIAPSSLAIGDVKNKSLWPLAIVILFACIVNYPCLHWGLQFGHDHNLHITYLHFFGAQLAAGELYPRWISGLNFGAGGPIFFVQYPLPYYAAAGLRRVLHISTTAEGLAHALGVFVFLTGIISGVTSWLWCRALANPIAALFASVAYITMPYVYGGDVFFRGSIGEYSALAWVPLALFFVEQIKTHPLRATAGIALAMALVILSNVFTAILFVPFLFLYAAFRVSAAGIRTPALLVCGALALAVGLSGVYCVPMNAHRKFFKLANLVKLREGIFDYRSNLFPFSGNLFPTWQFSLRMVSLISVVFALTTIAVLLLRPRRSRLSSVVTFAAATALVLTCAAPMAHLVGVSLHPELAGARVVDVRSRIFLITFLTLDAAILAYASLRQRADTLPNFLLGSCLACYFLSTRWSEWLWQRASFVWNIQFPWRLSGILSILAVGLFALALGESWTSRRRRNSAVLVFTVLWFGIGVASYYVLDIPQILRRPFFTEVRSKLESSYPAYASVSEWPESSEFGSPDGRPQEVWFVAGSGNAEVNTITSRHLRVNANCSTPCTLVVKLVYYPFWQAREANEPLRLELSPQAGLTQLSLTAGIHNINLDLPVARSELWGALISLMSLLLICAMFFQDNGRKRVTASLRSDFQEVDDKPAESQHAKVL